MPAQSGFACDGNRRSPPDDYIHMRCDDARELLSAAFDDEVTTLERQGLDAHLRRCPSCRDYADALGDLPSEAPTAAEAGPARSPAVVFLRLSLGTVAAVLVARSVPEILAHLGGDHSGVATHHLVAWDLAFGVGLLVVAVQPFRVRGLLPMALAIAVVMALTMALDAIGGHPSGMSGASHLLELIGLVLLWRLERAQFPPTHRLSRPKPRRPHPVR